MTGASVEIQRAVSGRLAQRDAAGRVELLFLLATNGSVSSTHACASVRSSRPAKKKTMRQTPMLSDLKSFTPEQARAYMLAAKGDELAAALSLARDRNALDGSATPPDDAEVHHALFLAPSRAGKGFPHRASTRCVSRSASARRSAAQSLAIRDVISCRWGMRMLPLRRARWSRSMRRWTWTTRSSSPRVSRARASAPMWPTRLP